MGIDGSFRLPVPVSRGLQADICIGLGGLARMGVLPEVVERSQTLPPRDNNFLPLFRYSKPANIGQYTQKGGFWGASWVSVRDSAPKPLFTQ